MIMQQEKQSTRAAAMGSNDVRAGTTPPQPDDQSREDPSARPACGDEVALAPMAASRTKPETNAQNGRTIARRVLAVGALLLGCGLAVASNWIDPLRVCETVSGGDPLTVVNVCNPWSEFELVPFLLVGLLFLSPDLSELSVLSLVTLKREVKAQQTELEATAQRQDALEMSLSAQIVNIHRRWVPVAARDDLVSGSGLLRHAGTSGCVREPAGCGDLLGCRFRVRCRARSLSRWWPPRPRRS